ncbi:carbohydrate kinase family protein [Lederbergia sp. NSJ-179]|uniref:carbohydrate kinase family protein n=1 Tax=Lederbergia sp. NSJ-179 TaxID=2931402 RepID=UPI001FD529BE|nr:carbohydrate kinase family protein [Lederbergia sp. NSJ-179]MCJ7841553.1 carbohydrate kinase family protein [Lederbergia sp. NSJ-179]
MVKGKKNLSENNVVVIGELNVDFILTGEEVIPEWNREKLINEFNLVLGSSSAITACCLAGLGLNVRFVGMVGDDSFGEFCIEKLKARGVDTSYVKKIPNIKTGVTLSFSTSKDRGLLTYMGSIPHLMPKDLPENLLGIADHIHFGSYYLQKGMQEYWNQLFSDAHKYGISTSFDVGWDPYEEWNRDSISELLQYTDLFIPSKDEFQHIFFDLRDRNRISEKLPEKRGMIVIKCGAEGSCAIVGNEMNKAPGYPVNAVDTTGAGDSFNAGLICGYLEGKRDLELLSFSNACGALATLRIGGAEDVPNKEEVESFLKKEIAK